MLNKLIFTPLLLLFFAVQFTSCKKSSTTTTTPPTLSTSAPTFSNDNITFNGDILTLGSGYYAKGFVWGVNTNPDILTSYNNIPADGSGAGPFMATTFTGYGGYLSSGSTYNVRAYAVIDTNYSKYVYGNNITFTVP